MNLSRLFIAFLLTGACAGSAAYAAEAGTALRTSEIRATPYRDAKAVGALSQGDKVQILDRQRGWYQIKSAKGQGWVRMLSVRRGEARKRSFDPRGVLDLASGRSGTGQVVATTGIRGLDEEDLKEAKYSESEVKKVESFTVSQEQVRRFVVAGNLHPQKLDYLRAPD